MPAIDVATLSSQLDGPHRPLLVDVRRQSAREASGLAIPGAIWRDPALWLDWKDELASQPGPVVLFCAHGREISQGLSAALCAMGQDARYLQGGFAQWQEAGQPVTAIR